MLGQWIAACIVLVMVVGISILLLGQDDGKG